MIRPIRVEDAAALAAIYNHYIEHSTATFDTEPLSDRQMLSRLEAIVGRRPGYVSLSEAGEFQGYAYAHPWKEKAAYRYTLETTIYLAPRFVGQGIGRALLSHLVEGCRREGYRSLIACITQGNVASETLHRKMGFRPVSRFVQVGTKFGRWIDVADYQLLLVE